MADEHARVFAESAREDDEKVHEAVKLTDEVENQLQRLRECVALRHRQCMAYVRDEITEIIADIRENRETLRAEYANYI